VCSLWIAWKTGESILSVMLSALNDTWRKSKVPVLDPYFLDLGSRWRWVVSFMSLSLKPRGKAPRYPLDRRLGGPHTRSGRHGEVKILEPTDRPARSQSLYRQCYPGSWHLIHYSNHFVLMKSPLLSVYLSFEISKFGALLRSQFRTVTNNVWVYYCQYEADFDTEPMFSRLSRDRGSPSSIDHRIVRGAPAALA
jgi:hypothetical protein